MIVERFLGADALANSLLAAFGQPFEVAFELALDLVETPLKRGGVLMTSFRIVSESRFDPADAVDPFAVFFFRRFEFVRCLFGFSEFLPLVLFRRSISDLYSAIRAAPVVMSFSSTAARSFAGYRSVRRYARSRSLRLALFERVLGVFLTDLGELFLGKPRVLRRFSKRLFLFRRRA
ncbi:MAG: hypothetical protein IPJ30_08715 [Acidobacteria bacterium]|nr:hypothetical protein [Acidobacteriota bacterium]